MFVAPRATAECMCVPSLCMCCDSANTEIGWLVTLLRWQVPDCVDVPVGTESWNVGPASTSSATFGISAAVAGWDSVPKLQGTTPSAGDAPEYSVSTVWCVPGGDSGRSALMYVSCGTVA